MIEERQASTYNGYTAIIVLLLLTLATPVAIGILPMMLKIPMALFGLLVLACWLGFFMVAPNQGRVLQLFGRYVGSERSEGLRWANPLYMKAKVSLRVRNFESGTLKVNDSKGNPIDIAAVVVWKVVDTAEALFEVDDYENYVQIQSEAALRNLATTHPYDSFGEEGQDFCLRGSPEERWLRFLRLKFRTASARLGSRSLRRVSVIWLMHLKLQTPCCSGSRRLQ